MDRIVTLIENAPGIRKELSFEHGLSLWVERAGRAVIFDTGAGESFVRNARLLGIDLSRAEAIVASHGHSDHSGGVRALYGTLAGHPPLVTGPAFFDPKYAFEHGGCHYLGPDFGESWLAENGVEHRTVGNGSPGTSMEIIPGVHVVNGFSRNHPEEPDNPRFVVDRGGALSEKDLGVDDFRDEVCLAVETRRGLVVVLGCAHPGAMNMVDQVRTIFGGRIRAVLGGTHLMDAETGRIEETYRYLRSLGCDRVGICHCSGQGAADLIRADADTYYGMQTGSCLFL
jgi:7,8-dihydropterin-6-yl-methyl-4-(beta-D-ribofuranosyl)aminobenzene 5'-phosphate synthase